MINYQDLGFKCGIEIHQQLETHKLFCKCPSLVNDNNPEMLVIKRKLRAVAGETGRIDKAAEHEMTKGKNFIYQSKPTSSCLVELDEEPPHEVNKEALMTALEIALILKATIVDEIQFMRKTVIDGSNTSGFQRTALIARDGYIETSKGKVRIPIICLEEEAAKKIEETNDSVTYSLDRLGVALVEIGTAADIKNPEHAKETAEKLGMILRSSGEVKRGLGTIRQDVNISIKDGARTEIKGFQDLKSIPKVIDYEVNRQLKLIKEGKKINEEVRKAEPDLTTTFLRPMPGAARMYPETDIPTIKITKNLLEKIKLPELLDEKALRFEKEFSLNSYLARDVIEQEEFFIDLVSKFRSIQPSFIAQVIIEVPKEIKKRFNLDTTKLKESDFLEVLEKLNKNEISKDAVLEILVQKLEGKKIDYSKYKTISNEEIKHEIKEIIKNNKGASLNALMGIVMTKYRGKVDGKELMEILKKEIS